MNKRKTSIVFTGDIGFDRYMDKRWEDENLLSKDMLDFFHSADHVVANVEGALTPMVPTSFPSPKDTRTPFFSRLPGLTRVSQVSDSTRRSKRTSQGTPVSSLTPMSRAGITRVWLRTSTSPG